MISKNPFANAIAPPTDDFKRLEAGGFKDWRLVVDGTVAHPLVLSLADLKTLPVRSQITEVACEEGWSYIAEWIGTPLSGVLQEAGVLPQTRYIVYHAFEKYLWGSIDMGDAMDPHTLLTMGMNDGDLPVPFGGPLRIRLPRQLRLQEPEVCHAHHGDRRHQEVRQGTGLSRSGVWLLVVCGNLKGRERREGLFAGLRHEFVVTVIDGHDSAAEKFAVRLGTGMHGHRISFDVCILPHHVSGS